VTVLVDSSAWVEYLRRTGTAEHHRVRDLVESSQDATTDPVMLEVVGGGRSVTMTRALSRLLARSQYLPQRPHEDVLGAIDIYQRCRVSGETVRSLNDCLIAAIAIRNDTPVLHRDRDFEVMARHTPLRIDAA
jgi:predicted nucleic acid-binding protein